MDVGDNVGVKDVKLLVVVALDGYVALDHIWLIVSNRLSSNKQIIQLKCIENLHRQGQCQMKTVHLSLRIPLIGF